MDLRGGGGMIPSMAGFRLFVVVLFSLAGCGPSAGKVSQTEGTGVLAFTDANVVPVSGGYADATIPVAPGTDLCFDTSALGGTAGSLAVWRVGMGEDGLRCAFGLESLTQASFTGGLFTAAPGAERMCLSEMDLYLDEPVLTCERGTTWAVMVLAADGSSLAYRILDPCAGDGATDVVIDATAPSFTDVTADDAAATTLSVEAGVQYTLDWGALSVDTFGAPVDPADLYLAVVADLTSGVPLSDAVLAPEDNADVFYELWAHAGATERDLAEEYAGPGFTGFEAGHRYLVGFSPPSDCIQASVIANVEVAE